jgi:hypothetical protein
MLPGADGRLKTYGVFINRLPEGLTFGEDTPHPVSLIKSMHFWAMRAMQTDPAKPSPFPPCSDE